ncbi:MAG TPA: CpsB/CapC family capsule biosynthesis tyrosine phosphatase [Solirubrobacteraceae bacterium]|nr:CpsB/CapC family capsule biosynthesis tyrosine phosphatase [Solirubrobacteraceae bacterium]
MIDLHTHILPGLDDGALDIDDSLAMARIAISDGISVVCATPHVRGDHDVRIEQLPDRVLALQRALDDTQIELRVVPGGEISALVADSLSERHLRALCLGAGDWVLLEPAPGPITDELPALVERLAARGARTVVAHPERHAGADFESLLQRLAGRGCLLQWTADFLAKSDAITADLISRLAANGLVHLLASDAHSSHGGRPLKLSHGAEWLRRRGLTALASWSVREGPAAVLRGGPVAPPVSVNP